MSEFLLHCPSVELSDLPTRTCLFRFLHTQDLRSSPVLCHPRGRTENPREQGGNKRARPPRLRIVMVNPRKSRRVELRTSVRRTSQIRPESSSSSVVIPFQLRGLCRESVSTYLPSSIYGGGRSGETNPLRSTDGLKESFCLEVDGSLHSPYSNSGNNRRKGKDSEGSSRWFQPTLVETEPVKKRRYYLMVSGPLNFTWVPGSPVNVFVRLMEITPNLSTNPNFRIQPVGSGGQGNLSTKTSMSWYILSQEFLTRSLVVKSEWTLEQNFYV